MTRYVIRAPSREAEARRASCEIADRHFEALGPAPIYRMVTLLWLHGHGGAEFEVWDDVSPLGKPGGLAMTGRVCNWAELRKGKVRFNARTKGRITFTADERAMVASAAGTVTTIAPRGVRQGVHSAISPSDGSTTRRASTAPTARPAQKLDQLKDATVQKSQAEVGAGWGSKQK
jgi:hypothetical protein